MNKRIYRLAAGMLLPVIGLTMSASVMAGELSKGDRLPFFSAKSLDGMKYTDKDVTGMNLGVMYFFSSKCKTCQNGLKYIGEFGSAGDSGVATIAMGKGDVSSIDSYVKDLNINYPVVAGNKDLLDRFGAAYIFPTTVITGPDGKVVQVLQGKKASEQGLLAALAEKHMQRGKIDVAGKMYSKIADKDSSGLAKAGLGYSQLKEGRLAEAEVSFKSLSMSKDSKVSARGDAGLAQVYLEKGDVKKAIKLSSQALKKNPESTAANLAHGRAMFKKGDITAATEAIEKAASDKTKSDFAFEKTSAFITKGNLERQTKGAEISLVSYEMASEIDPFSAEAVSSQGAVLQEMDKPEKALELFKKASKNMPNDRMLASLMRQAEASMELKRSIEKQKYISSMVKDLSKRLNEKRDKSKGKMDNWTSSKPAVWILDFKSTRKPDIDERAGSDSVLEEEIYYLLEEEGVNVVEREMLDKILAELNLGSSELADPDFQSRLGRMMSARLIVTGALSKRGRISMKTIDTETSARVVSGRVKQKDGFDPIDAAEKFSEKILKTIKKDYPIKAIAESWENDFAVLNLGEKHGITEGMEFEVFADENAVRGTSVGKLIVKNLGEKVAHATIVGKTFPKEKYYVRQIVK